MPRQKLTKTTLDRARAEAKEYHLWDTEVPGFGVRVQPTTGHRTFVFYCRPGGGRGAKQRKVRIGEFPAVTVEQARRKAKALAADVAQGRDPGAMRDSRRADDRAALAAPTVADAGVPFLAYVAKHNKPKTLTDYSGLWRNHIVPALGSLKVADVTQKHARTLHNSLSGKATTANRAIAVLGVFFGWAAAEGLTLAHQPNPARVGKRSGGIRLFAEPPRTRFLVAEEYQRVAGALRRAESEGVPAAPNRRRKPATGENAKHRPKSAGQPIPANPYAVAAIRLLALTGWREKEALNLRWAEADPSRPGVTLMDTKTGKSHRQIGKAARALLTSIPKLDGSPFVFPGVVSRIDDDKSAHELKPLREINRVWYGVRHAATGLAGIEGAEDATLHTFRHSFATVGKDLGYSDEVIARLLGHKRDGTTGRYAHIRDSVAQEAADRIAATIAGYMGMECEPEQNAPEQSSPLARAEEPRRLKLVAG